MSDFFKNIKPDTQESFFIGVFQDNLEKSRWHYHMEYELSFITEGSGKRIVGDSVEYFYPGDLIFIGPRLPHVWISDSQKNNLSDSRTFESVYMLFDNSVIPQEMLQLPEFTGVSNAILLSEKGLKIEGETLNDVSRIMLQLPYLKRFDRLISFFIIMNLIGASTSMRTLASDKYVKNRQVSQVTNNNRIHIIHEYLMENYTEDIKLDKLADLVSMAPGSLCRYFKSIMGVTLFEYLNKIKVEYACNLLKNVNLSIADIGYDCGFNNISHFNRQFRKYCGLTPKDFRKLTYLNNV